MFDKIVSAKVKFSKRECYCGIQDFYDLIARKLGYDPEKVQYDCTKICVTKPTQDQIYSFYKNEHQKAKKWAA